MKKSIVFLVLGILFISCNPWAFESTGLFSSHFSGEFKGIYYQKRSGEVRYFDTTSAPVLIKGGGVNEIKLIENGVLKERLIDVVILNNKKLQKRKRTAIFSGEAEKGGKVTLRMRLANDDLFKNENISLISSNFISGDYDESKDTVDIYYSRVHSQ